MPLIPRPRCDPVGAGAAPAAAAAAVATSATAARRSAPREWAAWGRRPARPADRRPGPCPGAWCCDAAPSSFVAAAVGGAGGVATTGAAAGGAACCGAWSAFSSAGLWHFPPLSAFAPRR